VASYVLRGTYDYIYIKIEYIYYNTRKYRIQTFNIYKKNCKHSNYIKHKGMIHYINIRKLIEILFYCVTESGDLWNKFRY